MSRQRGILGVQKNPKRQMLFMFKVPEGEEWPSSDSEDSDYDPVGKTAMTDSDASADEQPSKRAKTQRPAVRSKRSRTGARQKQARTGARVKKGGEGGESGAVSVSVPLTPVPQLPPELWLHIFTHHVHRHGALPFLCRAARVCSLWRELASRPSLWRCVDLSYGWIKSTDLSLKWLAHHRLSLCRSLNLSGWKNLTNDAVKVLCEKCPHLQTVNVSHCSKLTSVSVTALVTHCPQLSQLDLSFVNADAVSPQSLKRLTETVGVSLTSLSIAGNSLRGANLILNSIMEHCPKLSTLDLSNCKFSTQYLIVNVEKLQASCPLLRILGLANCMVRGKQVSEHVQAQATGFVELQELSCATVLYSQQGVPDNLLARLLHKAERLRLLDLRGCVSVHLDTLLSAPPLGVEELYLSQACCGYDQHTLVALFTRWRHSLQVLDLSHTHTTAEHLYTVVQTLTQLPSCPLTSLSLAGTSVLLPTVSLALDKLRQLRSLDLTSCRSLPRGIKRQYDGARSLKTLSTSLLTKGQHIDSDTDSY